MRLAIMQPYFFPYVGYFQLMHAVDKFVLFDDVHYINKGWINRNRILVNGKAHVFTVPLSNASQNTLIKDLRVAADEKWKRKFLKTLESSYNKAPQFEKVFPLIRDVIQNPSELFIEWLRKSIYLVRDYLGLKTEIVESSGFYRNQHLKGQDRILDICNQEKTDVYINAINGRGLYDPNRFSESNISLKFVQSDVIQYEQFDRKFVEWLSVIDVMFFNAGSDLKNVLTGYTLI